MFTGEIIWQDIFYIVWLIYVVDGLYTPKLQLVVVQTSLWPPDNEKNISMRDHTFLSSVDIYGILSFHLTMYNCVLRPCLKHVDILQMSFW